MQAESYQDKRASGFVSTREKLLVFSRHVLVGGKAVKRLCSHPTASLANTVRRPALYGLAL